MSSQVKITSRRGPGGDGIQETTKTTSSKLQQPSKYSEFIVRIGRRGNGGNIQETVTRKYQQPTKIEEIKTKHDPKTGTTKKVTSIGYKNEEKVVTETRRYGTPTNKQATATTSKYQPPMAVNEKIRKIGNPTNTNRTTIKYQQPTKVAEKRTRYGNISSSTKENTTTTSKYQPQTKVPETRTKYEPVTTTTTKVQPNKVVTQTRTRYGPLIGSNEEGYVTRPLKVIESTSRYGPETKTTKSVTYATYQESRLKPDSDNSNVVSEKRTEKYSNNNGNEKKEVAVEKTTDDGTKKRVFRRFHGSK